MTGLHPISRPALQRMVEKQKIVSDLIEGQLPLVEATQHFERLQSPACPRTYHEMEGRCRELIGWVRLALTDRPEQADVVTERLERELLQLAG